MRRRDVVLSGLAGGREQSIGRGDPAPRDGLAREGAGCVSLWTHRDHRRRGIRDLAQVEARRSGCADRDWRRS